MKKKVMKRRIILVIVLVLILLISCGWFFIKTKKLKVTYKKMVEVSIYDKLDNLHYITNVKNGSIITKKKNINTDTLGKKEVVVEIKDFFGKVKKIHYQVNVVDKEKPVITFNKQLETTEGTEIDLLKDVKVTDNSKEKIIPVVDGEYDFNKAGDYNLKYQATDSSGNKASEDFVLKVNKKVNEVKPKEQDNNSSNDNITYFTTSKGFKGYTKDGVTYIDGYLVVNKTYSLPSTYGSDLTSQTKTAANEMFAAAKLEGLNIYLSSGYRSYATQKRLYNNYVNRDGKEKADTYSARPGHSEHQSGLAFDVNQINDSFNNTPEAKWLANNCYKYGFILRYPEGKTNETGYKYESWHFRYVGKELAQKLYNNGDWITMETYFGITSTY